MGSPLKKTNYLYDCSLVSGNSKFLYFENAYGQTNYKLIISVLLCQYNPVQPANPVKKAYCIK